jgi:antitoxin PrlF
MPILHGESVAMAIMTSNGRITIPVRVRQSLGVLAGDRVEFVEIEKGQFVIVPASKRVKKLKGVIQKSARPAAFLKESSLRRGPKTR